MFLAKKKEKRTPFTNLGAKAAVSAEILREEGRE